MTLAQLRAFYWIAKLGSFRAAAERTHLTQPTISLRIRELERQLGARILERTGQHVSLTSSGTQLLAYAERILSLSDEVLRRLRTGDPLDSPLRLGAVDSFAVSCLPDMLAALTKDHPNITADLTVTQSKPLQEKVQEGQIDMAIVIEPLPAPDLVIQPLARLRICWVAAPGVGLKRQVLHPRDLARLPILTTSPDSVYCASLRRWFERDGVEPRRISTCSSLSTLVALAVAGMGISLLPLYAVQTELRARTLRMLRTAPATPRSTLAMIYLKRNEASHIPELIAAARGVIARKVH